MFSLIKIVSICIGVVVLVVSSSKSPSLNPSKSPSLNPSKSPSLNPSKSPSLNPTTSAKPSGIPDPKKSPAKSPECVTPTSTKIPTLRPSLPITKIPTLRPSLPITIDQGLPKYASSVNGKLTYKFYVSAYIVLHTTRLKILCLHKQIIFVGPQQSNQGI